MGGDEIAEQPPRREAALDRSIVKRIA